MVKLKKEEFASGNTQAGGRLPLEAGWCPQAETKEVGILLLPTTSDVPHPFAPWAPPSWVSLPWGPLPQLLSLPHPAVFLPAFQP